MTRIKGLKESKPHQVDDYSIYYNNYRLHKQFYFFFTYMHNIIKIATLNVKGLNDKQKFQETMTLLKSYRLDLILIQETNLHDHSIKNFLAQ